MVPEITRIHAALVTQKKEKEQLHKYNPSFLTYTHTHSHIHTNEETHQKKKEQQHNTTQHNTCWQESSDVQGILG